MITKALDIVTTDKITDRLLYVLPAGQVFYANFNEDLNSIFGQIPVSAPGCSRNSGRLILDHTSNSCILYSALGFPYDNFTIRFNIFPKYTGTPGENAFIFSLGNANDSNMIKLYHSTDGNIYVKIFDSAGLLVFDSVVGSWNPSMGTNYEFEFSINTQSKVSLFIDGVLLNDVLCSFSRGSHSDDFYIGGDTSGVPWFDFDNIAVYSSIIHSANFPDELPREEQKVYPIDNPFTFTQETPLDKIFELPMEFSYPAGDEITIIPEVNGQFWSYNTITGIWEESGGNFIQSNSISDLNTTVLQALVTTPSKVRFKVFFHSENGLTTPILESLGITYDFAVVDLPVTHQTVVYGFAQSSKGVKSGITVKAKLNRIAKYETEDRIILIFPEEYTTITDERGYWEFSLLDTESMLGGCFYSFDFEYPEMKQRVCRKVPKVDSIELEKIV